MNPGCGGDAGPFDLTRQDTYRRWRDAVLAGAPVRLEELLVQIRQPDAPSAAERRQVAHCVHRANMVILCTDPRRAGDRSVPVTLGRAFGLENLDHHLMADGDGLSSLSVADGGDRRGEFIPYTDRPIQWHTDGYYHDAADTIRALQLFCVRPAARGGENRLLDHRRAYITLRDREPELVRALMAPDAMTVPARLEADGSVARPAVAGPVFSVHGGALHMRYTARTRSIAWRDDDATRAARQAIESLLADDASGILTARLEPGMSLLCNNILHDRSGFTDDPHAPRLILRGRYREAIAAP